VTAGKLLFGGDISGNFFAMDPANGSLLWHARIGGGVERAADLQGRRRQHVLVARATRCIRLPSISRAGLKTGSHESSL
jgi:hypothetical protein